MGKLKEFAIELTSPQLVYYPGQVVAGYVIVDLNEPMEARGIQVKLEGKAYCHWQEKNHNDEKEEEYTDYKGKETIVKLKASLFGSEANSSRVMIPEGRQSYFFSLNLPPSMPSSLEVSYGHIRYILKAKIDKPWKFDHKVKKPITVNDLIDPNLPMYSKGGGGEKHKEVGCLCCKAGPLDVSASIDRGAYCPGEAILITANVANHTSRDMGKISAALNQRITYTAKGGHTKISTAVISTLNGPSIPSGEYAKWDNQAFGIPAIPPTIRNTKVISVDYSLNVEVDVPWGFDPCIPMDVVIGTVPYVPTYGQSFNYGTPENPMAPPEINFSGGLAYPPPPSNVLGYPDIPPPSYSAATGAAEVNTAKGEKDQYTYGQMKYTPVYTFAQPYQGTVPPYNPQYPNPDQQYPPNQPSVPYPT